MFFDEEILLRLYVVVSVILFMASLSTGSDWPGGWYGLPMPKSRCPSSEWGSGWWFEERRANNQSTSRIPHNSHLKGNFNQSSTKRYFCMKKKDNGLDKPWPNGQYCIYRWLLKNCTEGFVTGWIGWKDKKAPNKNEHSKKLYQPSGVYTSNTRINYCCKVNGSKENSISLPTNKPFILLAYNSSKCQSVKWTRSTQEYLRFSRQESISFNGIHPFVDENYALRYCYYQSSNQTIGTVEHQGTISRHLNQTSIQQERYSAWHIKPHIVVALRFVVLRFSRFIFQANNVNSYMEVFDGDHESSPSLGRFSSNQSPLDKNLTSLTKLFVLLHFGDRNGTYDFEFNYHVVMTTVKPTTKTSSSTMTTSSTAHTSSLSSTLRQTTTKHYIQSTVTTTNPSHITDITVTTTNSTPGYLRYHDNKDKRKLLLSILLPITAGLVIVLFSVVIFLRRRCQRRNRYTRMNSSIYESDFEDNMDGYFEEIQLSPTCSLLQLTTEPTELSLRLTTQTSDWSLNFEHEPSTIDRNQQDFEETETHDMAIGTSNSVPNRYESDPGPENFYFEDLRQLQENEQSELNEAENIEMMRLLGDNQDNVVLLKPPQEKDKKNEASKC